MDIAKGFLDCLASSPQTGHAAACKEPVTAVRPGFWQASVLAAATLAISLHGSMVYAQGGTTNASPTHPVHAAVLSAAKNHEPLLLNTLKQLVEMESGSRDLQGLRQVADYLANAFRDLKYEVEVLPTRAPDFHPQLKGAELGPMVLARKRGTGSKKVLLIAHMDTVYPRGTLDKQPFRVDGNKAYGLGIADDKAGVALILHTARLLEELQWREFGELAILINGDEEVGSPGSSETLVRLGGQYDAVFSFEGGGFQQDMVRLATSSIAIAELKVKGRASHAGSNPEGGRNAIYELAHLILKTRSLGDPQKGLKINWTVVEGGGVRNVIPAQASAVADIRSFTNEDLDLMENALKAATNERLIPDTQVELVFHRSRPAFVPNAAAFSLARKAQAVFQEIGKPLEIRDKATGGGTDAAFAGLRPRGGVLESFGLRGFGAHSNDNEYIFIDSIVPKLYLATRMVMEEGK